ncbi:MAG TPA: hypothetical protein VHD87_11240 [Acidimicrobiales bacterium]|nr:hypothetical protein [Acidimicrobiales bacterium]
MTVPENFRRYVTLREAADETGASVPALRRWYREGLIASTVVPGTHGDQRLVDLDDVVARAAASPNLGRRRAAARTDQEAVIDALVEQVAALSMEVSDLRERLDALET